MNTVVTLKEFVAIMTSLLKNWIKLQCEGLFIEEMRHEYGCHTKRVCGHCDIVAEKVDKITV